MSSSNRVNVYVFAACILVASQMISVTDSKCGRTNLSERTGVILSPGYPGHYPSHSWCSWLISVPAGHYIKLQFLHFALEDTFDCIGDVLKAFDGPNTSATLLGKYCGKKNDFFSIISTSNVMLVTFRSDRSVNLGGFRANFTAVLLNIVGTPSTPLHFNKTLRNTTIALARQEVKLHCVVGGGTDNVQIQWSKNGQMLEENGPSHSIKFNAVTKKSLLKLKNVSKSDEGIYGCLASDNGHNISTFGSLQVKVPAIIVDGPLKSITLNAGDSILQTCKTFGYPVPRVIWLVNGKNMTNKSSQSNYMSSLPLTATVDVVVNCTASNGYGQDWKAGKIVVDPAPTLSPMTEEPTITSTVDIRWPLPVITKPPANKTAKLGENVTLTCASEGDPQPTIRWLADGDYFENMPQDENGTSYFTFTLKKQHASVRCEAQNPYGIDKRTAYITAPTGETLPEASPWLGPFGQMAFIAVICCAILAALMIVFGLIFLYRRHNMKSHSLAAVPVDVEKLQNNPIFETHVNQYMNPKLSNWEVPRNQMEFIKDMGPGNGKFTQLFLGKISQTRGECEEISLVIVKLLKKKDVSQTEKDNFEKDALSLTMFSHPNIQSLFGVCAIGYPVCLVFEYSESDECLHQFLNESGRNHCSISRRGEVETPKPKLSNVDQMCIAKQIANGMEYLAAKGYVHRELCTKNCIIGKGMVVKISNLGFSWMGPNTDFYSLEESEQEMYPLRWLPPETIETGEFVEDTDIWSYGIVLWEIYSGGLTPYYGMSDEEVISLIKDGDILPCPKECPKEMYEIMQGCWNLVPSERPRFSSIHHRISSLFNGVPV